MLNTATSEPAIEPAMEPITQPAFERRFKLRSERSDTAPLDKMIEDAQMVLMTAQQKFDVVSGNESMYTTSDEFGEGYFDLIKETLQNEVHSAQDYIIELEESKAHAKAGRMQKIVAEGRRKARQIENTCWDFATPEYLANEKKEDEKETALNATRAAVANLGRQRRSQRRSARRKVLDDCKKCAFDRRMEALNGNEVKASPVPLEQVETMPISQSKS
eukprot:TRINITY_DN893_c0_g3_i1.p1 TRINITY_DN893_c0_g3~~TRINITY_DN893_c0_g3_i1.p1  ORF type:complete len:218 (+),score=36.54 TRINITY_DN893_c0_g3_i1:303-956(+)